MSLKRLLNVILPFNLSGLNPIVLSVASLSAVFMYAVMPDTSPMYNTAHADRAGIHTAPSYNADAVPGPLNAARSAPEKTPPTGTENKKPPPLPRAPFHAVSGISRGDAKTMKLSLTFDGGYTGDETMAILDILKEKGVRTTMFLTGVFMVENPDIVLRIVRDGHEVGNHTMTHPHLTDYSGTGAHVALDGVDRALVSRELGEAREVFRSITGQDMARLWRAPYGETNRDIISWAMDEGFLHVGWTVDYSAKKSLDTLDWVWDLSSPLYLSANGIRERILDFERESGLGGGIALMHLGTKRGADRATEILPGLIDELRSRGYSFVKVSELVEDRARLAMRRAEAKRR